MENYKLPEKEYYLYLKNIMMVLKVQSLDIGCQNGRICGDNHAGD